MWCNKFPRYFYTIGRLPLASAKLIKKPPLIVDGGTRSVPRGVPTQSVGTITVADPKA
jgi:hypothetical protein